MGWNYRTCFRQVRSGFSSCRMGSFILTDEGLSTTVWSLKIAVPMASPPTSFMPVKLYDLGLGISALKSVNFLRRASESSPVTHPFILMTSEYYSLWRKKCTLFIPY